MEEIIEDIKRTLAGKTGKDIGASVKQWTADLKRRGISVMVLEELLHFYAMPHHATQPTDDSGFYLASEVEKMDDETEKKLQELRNQIDCLEHDLQSAKKGCKDIRIRCRLACVVAVCLFVTGLILGLLVLNLSLFKKA